MIFSAAFIQLLGEAYASAVGAVQLRRSHETWSGHIWREPIEARGVSRIRSRQAGQGKGTTVVIDPQGTGTADRRVRELYHEFDELLDGVRLHNDDLRIGTR